MTDPLAGRVLARDPRAVARAISLVENESAAGVAVVREVFAHTGRAALIGITGPPGAGKSTLVDRLTRLARDRDQTVGVIAVDPTSPFTGGAVLGDRVRMQAHAGDAGVFIRSMATRGHLGGLARATSDVALVLDASGHDLVFIETVGVGQGEVDIVRTADVSVVTLVPGTGDDVQALKAGIMEIADVFVVNKADREGADRMAASIEAILALQDLPADAWRPPVLLAEAATGRGVAEVLHAIDRFRAHQDGASRGRRAVRAGWRLREIVGDRFLRHVASTLPAGELEAMADRVADRDLDPYTASEDILARALERPEAGGMVLDHVGLAVGEIEAVLAFYRDVLGLDADAGEEVPSQRVRVRFLQAGQGAIELVEPTAAESPVARFLERRGPGLHHLALRVPDVRAALERLRERGVRLIDPEPRPGAHGTRVAFIHPAASHGVLVELVERPGSGEAAAFRASNAPPRAGSL